MNLASSSYYLRQQPSLHDLMGRNSQLTTGSLRTWTHFIPRQTWPHTPNSTSLPLDFITNCSGMLYHILSFFVYTGICIHTYVYMHKKSHTQEKRNGLFCIFGQSQGLLNCIPQQVGKAFRITSWCLRKNGSKVTQLRGSTEYVKSSLTNWVKVRSGALQGSLLLHSYLFSYTYSVLLLLFL